MCFGSGSRSASPPPRPQQPAAYPLSTRPPNAQRYHPRQPSSSGHFYPGSTFARTESAKSSGSAASNISIASAHETVRSIQESRGIEALARCISMDLGDLDGTLNELQARRQRMDPRGYKKREPWTPGMLNAWQRYKGFVKDAAVARRAFLQSQAPKTHVKWEHHLERAKLALAWGEMAVRAAEGRILFMKMYQDAFPLEGFAGHYQQANSAILGGRTAVQKAREEYGRIWAVLDNETAHSAIFR